MKISSSYGHTSTHTQFSARRRKKQPISDSTASIPGSVPAESSTANVETPASPIAKLTKRFSWGNRGGSNSNAESSAAKEGTPQSPIERFKRSLSWRSQAKNQPKPVASSSTPIPEVVEPAAERNISQDNTPRRSFADIVASRHSDHQRESTETQRSKPRSFAEAAASGNLASSQYPSTISLQPPGPSQRNSFDSRRSLEGYDDNTLVRRKSSDSGRSAKTDASVSTIGTLNDTLPLPSFPKDPKGHQAWESLKKAFPKMTGIKGFKGIIKAKSSQSEAQSTALYDVGTALTQLPKQQGYLPYAKAALKSSFRHWKGANVPKGARSKRLLALAKINKWENDPAKAEEYARKALRVSPGNETAQLWLAELVEKTNPAEAETIYTQLLKSGTRLTKSDAARNLARGKTPGSTEQKALLATARDNANLEGHAPTLSECLIESSYAHGGKEGFVMAAEAEKVAQAIPPTQRNLSLKLQARAARSQGDAKLGEDDKHYMRAISYLMKMPNPDKPSLVKSYIGLTNFLSSQGTEAKNREALVYLSTAEKAAAGNFELLASIQAIRQRIEQHLPRK